MSSNKESLGGIVSVALATSVLGDAYAAMSMSDPTAFVTTTTLGILGATAVAAACWKATDPRTA